MGGIVLAGGRSSRMGAAKAGLEWHGSTLLRRMAGLLLRSVDGPVVVARAPGQPLPRLPSACEVVEDARADRGPLEGLAAALARLGPGTEVAFVTATDAPLLHPDFIAAVLAGLRAGDDACVPVVAGRAHPLAAAYRPRVAGYASELLAEDRLRVGLLLDRCRVHRVDARALLAHAPLRRSDPGLESLVNLNEAGDYTAARARPGPPISLRPPDGPARAARAATLGRAAAAAGLTLGADVVACLNGRPAGADPELPLVGGDLVAFARRPAEAPC